MKRLKNWQILVMAGLILFVGYVTNEYISLFKDYKFLCYSLKDEKGTKRTLSTVNIPSMAQEKATNITTEIEYEIPSDVEQKEKILIDQSRQHEEFEDFDWCGSQALVVNKSLLEKSGYEWIEKSGGIEWIDIFTKKRVRISENKEDRLLGGSSDGRWVIYASNSSPNTEWSGGCFGWDKKSTADVYRYEVSSGKKEMIGIMAADWPFKALSPDGKRIFLGVQLPVKKEINMTEPKWERLYFKEKDWEIEYGTAWFPDSSGVVTRVSSKPGRHKIAVEIFGQHGWSKIFEQGVSDWIDDLKTEKDKTIYFKGESQSKLNGQGWFLYKGKISQNKELAWKKVLERGGISDYAILSDGNIVVREYNPPWDKYLYCIDPKRMKEKWVVKIGGRNRDRGWISIGEIKVSPDERWLAFIEYRHMDDFLFVVKLKD